MTASEPCGLLVGRVVPHKRRGCYQSFGFPVLARYASLAGERERALTHLRIAIDGDPQARECAATESDLDAIRADPEYPS